MDLDLPPIPDAERPPLVETLLGIIDLLHQRVHTLEETVQQLRDEIAVLKGQSPRPKIAPSQLTKPAPLPIAPDQKRPGSDKRAKNASFLTPIEVRIPCPDRPPGAVSNGYEEYLVQELVLEAKVTRYWRERILLPDGSSRLAPLPDDVLPGLHFGPGLLGFILYQHNQCNVTQGKLLEQLHELGLDISAGELSRLLADNHDGAHQEKAEVLQAGLQSSDYAGVDEDDTGARHQGSQRLLHGPGQRTVCVFREHRQQEPAEFHESAAWPGDGLHHQ